MSNVNNVILIGRLGKDPDYKKLDNGEVCNFSLATTEKWNDRNGERQEKTTWHRITTWGKLADICNKYLQKGSLAYVEGKISERQYDKDGETRYVTEIVAHNVQILSSKQESDQPERPKNYAPQKSSDEIPW